MQLLLYLCMSTRKGESKMKRKIQIIAGLILAFLIFTVPLQAQESFWCGNPIAEFLDPNTADAYHDFLVDTVMPVIRSEISSVGSNNPESDKGVTIYDSDRCWNGYTLLSSMAGHQPDTNGPMYNAILVDMDGNLIREWAFGNARQRWPFKMIPGGYVWGGGQLPNGEKVLQLQDWDGNVVKQFDPEHWHHHDYQREGNPVGYYVPGMEPMLEGGKTLILGNFNPDPNLTAHISEFTLKDDILWELDWDGNVLWQWEGWEHFEQFGFDVAARDAIKCIGRQGGAKDWLHANAASWIGPNKWYDQGDLRFHPDNIILSFREANITLIVARYDHPEGQWISGDVIWRVGPDYSADFPEHKLGQIVGQHHSHLIPKGLPGAGNVLVFDNGGNAGHGAVVPGLCRGTNPNKLRDFTRVIEFDPTTMDLVWEYRQQHPTEDLDEDGDIKGCERKFFSAFISGATRLPNGNTLICEGACGRVFEVTTEGDIVWEYISPYTGAADAMVISNNVFRAYRIPASWLPESAVN